jgi:predicted transposase YdaD
MDIFEKEGDVTVCELWDEVRQEGRAEGRAKGRIEGRAEGEKKGEKKGEDKLAKLINKLMNENRFDDVTRATTDAEYRKTLYTEYKINA